MSTASTFGPARFFLILVTFALAFPSARGSQVVYGINANGAKEVAAGGTGDLDGSATGTLTLDNGTGSGTTGSVTFNLTLSNIDVTTLSGHHIHMGSATTSGGIVLDFGDPDTVRSGNTLSGTISGLNAAQITTIFSNPSNFYYNLHNGAFPSGAVRDQLVPIPEAGSAMFVLGSISGICSLRRRRRS